MTPLPQEYTEPGADFRTLEHGTRYGPPTGYRGEVRLREGFTGYISHAEPVEYVEFSYPGYMTATVDGEEFSVEYWEGGENYAPYQLFWVEIEG